MTLDILCTNVWHIDTWTAIPKGTNRLGCFLPEEGSITCIRNVVSVFTYLLHDGQSPPEEDYICMLHSTVKTLQYGINNSIYQKHNLPIHEGKEAKNDFVLNCLWRSQSIKSSDLVVLTVRLIWKTNYLSCCNFKENIPQDFNTPKLTGHVREMYCHL